MGSALIFKNKDDDNNVHEVHGLTTAASVWLSAAVGIACAGGLYFVASLSTAIMLVLLRFGPRTNLMDNDDEEEDFDEEEAADRPSKLEIDAAIANLRAAKQNQQKAAYQATELDVSEKDQLIPKARMSHSQRGSSHRRLPNNRPSLI